MARLEEMKDRGAIVIAVENRIAREFAIRIITLEGAFLISSIFSIVFKK